MQYVHYLQNRRKCIVWANDDGDVEEDRSANFSVYNFH